MNKDEIKEELIEDLIKLMDITVNEEILLKRISKHFSPKPKYLASTKEEGAKLKLKLSELSKKLGGPPNFFIRLEDEPTPVHDTYCEAAISEAINAFRRAYDTVCRTHMYSVAKNMLSKYDNLFIESVKKVEMDSLVELLSDRFWGKC